MTWTFLKALDCSVVNALFRLLCHVAYLRMEHHHTWKSTTLQFYAGDPFSQLIRQSIIPAVLVSLCCYNDDQKELGRRYLPCQSQSVNKGSQDRDSWQEPGGRYWSRDHGGLLLPTCSPGLLSYLPITPQAHLPGDGSPSCGLAPFISMPHKHPLGTIWWRQFLHGVPISRWVKSTSPNMSTSFLKKNST